MSNRDTTFLSNDSGFCDVNKIGTYTLYSTEIITGVESPVFKFPQFGNFADTVQSWALYQNLVVDKGSIESLSLGDWLYCGSKCEGHKIDYYYNGNKRIEGWFKKGKPLNSLKFYNESGKLEYIEYYNSQGKKIKSKYISK